MMKRLLTFFSVSMTLFLLECSGKIEEPILPKRSVLAIAQASKKILSVDPETREIKDFAETGDVPNFIVLPEDGAEGAITVINSGGFTGVSSIQFIFPDGSSKEIPLPQSMNPMEGTWVNQRLYFTDFGKVYSDKVFCLKDDNIVDSFKVGPRPIGIIKYLGYLFVACTGMDSSYQYGEGLLTRVNLTTREIKSLTLSPGASELSLSNAGKIVVLSTGEWNGNSTIYRIDPISLSIEDSVQIQGSLYTLAVSDSLLWAGSFYGDLYSFSFPSLDFLKKENLESTINSVFWDDYSSALWISLGGYSGGPNYILELSGESRNKTLLSGADIGIGYLTIYEPPK